MMLGKVCFSLGQTDFLTIPIAKSDLKESESFPQQQADDSGEQSQHFTNVQCKQSKSSQRSKYKQLLLFLLLLSVLVFVTVKENLSFPTSLTQSPFE